MSSTPDAAEGQRDAAVDGGPTCTDNVKNGSETDVDCGGTCGGCADGEVCTAPTDCSVGSCFAGHCGERMWTVESTGSNVGIPANQQWTAIPGASVTFTTYAQSQVFMRWMGTIRYVGASPSCHIGVRLVVDGVPTGNGTWGGAIVVAKGATRWHQPFNLEIAQLLAPGTHTVTAEAVNGINAATCNFDGDSGAIYDRSHLAVAAYDPQTAFYAESSGGTGPLGEASAWVDIPGVALTIPLAQASYVQLSMQGTQFSRAITSGTLQTEGHCAYRFVVDGAPLGHADHGQHIVIGDVDAGWWNPVGLKWGAELAAGNHAVRAQIRNSGPYGGSCEAAEGNNGYSKFRLFATATPVGKSIAVESTGPLQALAPNSAWTAITGATAQLELPAAAQVQVEVAGTQYSGTSAGTAQCAYRLVIDGMAQGHAMHGQAVNIGDNANAWWNYFGLLWGAKLPAGPHTFKVEARNSASSGQECHMNRDNLSYGRTRLLVRTL